MQKTRFSKKKTKQFRATVSIDIQEVVHGLFKEPIIGPLKSKMAEIRVVDLFIYSCLRANLNVTMSE